MPAARAAAGGAPRLPPGTAAPPAPGATARPPALPGAPGDTPSSESDEWDDDDADSDVEEREEAARVSEVAFTAAVISAAAAGASAPEVDADIRASLEAAGLPLEDTDAESIAMVAAAAAQSPPGATDSVCSSALETVADGVAIFEGLATAKFARAYQVASQGRLDNYGAQPQWTDDFIAAEVTRVVRAVDAVVPMHLLHRSSPAMCALHFWQGDLAAEEDGKRFDDGDEYHPRVDFLEDYCDELLTTQVPPPPPRSCPPSPLPTLTNFELGQASFVLAWAVHRLDEVLSRRAERGRIGNAARLEQSILQALYISRADSATKCQALYQWSPPEHSGLRYVHHRVVYALVPLFQLCKWGFGQVPLPHWVHWAVRSHFFGLCATTTNWNNMVTAVADLAMEVPDNVTAAASVQAKLAQKVIHVFGADHLHRVNSSRSGVATCARLKAMSIKEDAVSEGGAFDDEAAQAHLKALDAERAKVQAMRAAAAAARDKLYALDLS